MFQQMVSKTLLFQFHHNLQCFVINKSELVYKTFKGTILYIFCPFQLCYVCVLKMYQLSVFNCPATVITKHFFLDVVNWTKDLPATASYSELRHSAQRSSLVVAHSSSFQHLIHFPPLCQASSLFEVNESKLSVVSLLIRKRSEWLHF